MTDKREEELKRIPPLRSQIQSAGELRSISMDKIDLLQVDRNGRLYWDGEPVEVSRRLTFWQTVGAFTVQTVGRKTARTVATPRFGRRILPGRASREARYGIAMHGELAMPEDFAQLRYADPTAPKGGRFVQGVLGTFDNLNPLILSVPP
jgi:hypothetical protein